ncbi:MAG: response regulator transcription factor [Flavobacteriaceae bacterium]|nr:MAG: response regulator transcription factor [Flavobacteriaceae bacterium]
MKLRGIIIDDEFLARQRLHKLLETVPEVTIVADCKNGTEAVEKIRLKEPDFVFLDIQMPDMDGFQVLERLEQIPYVIFTTAYDSFALKAFEINAVDYLLKPFDEERLHKSIKRMISLKKTDSAIALEAKIGRLLNEYRKEKHTSFRNSFEIKKNGRLIQISVDSISYLKSEGNYLDLISDNGNYLFRATMNSLEDELSPRQFLRIHRSYIVNKLYVDKCIYQGNSEYKIRLKTGKTLVSGRSYKQQIQEYLEEEESSS